MTIRSAVCGRLAHGLARVSSGNVSRCRQARVPKSEAEIDGRDELGRRLRRRGSEAGLPRSCPADHVTVA